MRARPGLQSGPESDRVHAHGLPGQVDLEGSDAKHRDAGGRQVGQLRDSTHPGLRGEQLQEQGGRDREAEHHGTLHAEVEFQCGAGVSQKGQCRAQKRHPLGPHRPQPNQSH